LILSLVSQPALAVVEGVVYVDEDADGVRDADEPGRAGILVSNGRDVVTTDESGHYRILEGKDFVYITRPSGFICNEWYRRDGGDFALVRVPQADEFFFVQVSDAHVYQRIDDFEQYSSPKPPWWMPQLAVDWLTLRFLASTYTDGDTDVLVARLRDALSPYYEGDDLEDLWDISLYRAYRAEFIRPGSPLGNVAEAARTSLAEVAALDPTFVVHTGDLILEGNNGSAEAVERWFDFYAGLVGALPMPIYNTIGNNEIAGTRNANFGADDPRFGKRLFQRHFGPTWYSFDRGPFHFVALDTHRRTPDSEDPKAWSFRHMEADTQSWAEADLARHGDRVLVVLNHEPFHFDPSWPFGDEGQSAHDEGLFDRHEVPFVLTGHSHWNSFMPRNGTTHITTGALSGLRWVLPASVHERGYRLFYARERTLHSAWKRTGEIVIALAEPGSPRDDEWILVVADESGPFEEIEVTLGAEVLALERWGDYFIRVQGAGRMSHSRSLNVRASRSDGTRVEQALDID